MLLANQGSKINEYGGVPKHDYTEMKSNLKKQCHFTFNSHHAMCHGAGVNVGGSKSTTG